MARLSDQQLAIIKDYPIDPDELAFTRKLYFKFVDKSPSKPSFNDIASSAITDKEAKALITKLLYAVPSLDAASKLPSRYGSLQESLYGLCGRYGQSPEQVNIEAVGILLERVIEQPGNDESIWSAVYGLFHDTSIPTTPTRKGMHSAISTDVFNDMYKDWSRKFFEDALVGLQQQMRDCIKDESEYYARTLVFVQSSGMGKSRLADSFGQICPMINFIIREKGDGYPTPDHEVRDFMCMQVPGNVREIAATSPLKKGDGSDAKKFSERRLASIWNHCLAFAILDASIRKFHEWIVGQNHVDSLEKLAQLRHEEMKPVNASDKADPRSPKRIDFCGAVVEEASRVAVQLAKDKEWRRIFNDEEPSAFRVAMECSTHMKTLHLQVKNLMGDLEKCRRRNPNDNHQLAFVFDEASTLFHTNSSSSKSDSGRYVALNRIFSCLREFPVWFFFLSTESKVEKVLPTDTLRLADEDQDLTSANKNSARDASGVDRDQKLRVFPPFVAFPLDIEDRRKMRNPTDRKAELAKSMIEFSKPKHMAIFGRSLWHAYTNDSKMYSVAELKILGGSYEYNPKNKHHVFAVLSFRLALDACLESTISLPLLRTAVGSHMRVVISMDQRSGFLHTTSPSEPILAHASMKHLCSNGVNWIGSTDTLTRELLHQGLIEKGLKGELFARLLLILAHDSIRGALGVERMPTFTVKDFLLALYASDHHNFIQMIDAQILKARMNFTHFALTNANLLPGDDTLGLCHDLLRRSAALQLSPNNPAFDQLIPIYFGPDTEPFDRSKCGAIVIQNKNKGAATTPDHIFGEVFAKIGPEGQVGRANNQPPIRQKKKYAFGGMGRPILFLLFDLGTESGASAPIQVSCSTELPLVWAIHSRGHTEAIFGCLKTMGLSNLVAESFFGASAVERDAIHHEIARRNLIFDYMRESSRYASLKEDGSEYVEGLKGWRQDSDDDGKDIENPQDSKEDTPMADT